MTLVFECVDTVRFQVQEMARAEKILSDEAIQVELDIYNRLLPAPGELSATLFIELTTDDAPAGVAAPAGRDRARARASTSTATWCRACPRPTTRPPWSARRSPRPSTTCASAFTPAQVEAFGRPRRGGPGGDPPRLRGPDRPGPGDVRRELLGRPAWHNKAPADGLTRDNSVRKSLQAHRTWAILFVRRNSGAGAARSTTERASEQGECQYPPFCMRKCFP